MNDKNENLDGLINRLYGEEAAGEVRDDIRIGDEILDSFDSPKPDPSVIEGIKRDVSAAVVARRRRIHRRTVGYRTAVVAALLFIITGLGVRFVNYQRTSYTGYIVAIEDLDTAGFFGTDVQLAFIADELDEIESSMFSSGARESFSDLGDAVDEIEMEIIEVSSSLW